jgi:hypothetical protein
MLDSKVMTTESKILMLGSKIMMTESKAMMANSKILAMAASKILMLDLKVMSVSFRTQRRGDVEPPSSAECATASPRARRMHNGESRCQAPDQGECAMESPDFEPPEHGSSEVARIAVDEVAAAHLARTKLQRRWCRSRRL